ncbi:hypothetical protein GCM10007380_14280 [Gottfriedia solisilvae]|uniref:Uncharacterized protein n=1 Tax=Gottfriedia solisilvae TaxID=1516104 RepID=A0A8J3F0W7_9BACI|nr:hypothetical protein GCM10007380_14280 [Gottfriedia solisilvae]
MELFTKKVFLIIEIFLKLYYTIDNDSNSQHVHYMEDEKCTFKLPCIVKLKFSDYFASNHLQFNLYSLQFLLNESVNEEEFKVTIYYI